MKHLLFILLSALTLPAFAQQRIDPEQAKDHVGDSVNIIAPVYGVKVFVDDDKKPTLVLLNLGADYPNQVLTIAVYPGYASGNVSMPGNESKGKIANVWGRIEMYKGKPQIAVRSSKQLVFSSGDTIVPAK